ncbi:MAG TPA: hypothetical protein PK478_12615, partial [Nitrospira sp.]|nr:hypothetical protein [Nitrospira sp.]
GERPLGLDEPVTLAADDDEVRRSVDLGPLRSAGASRVAMMDVRRDVGEPHSAPLAQSPGAFEDCAAVACRDRGH